MKDHVIPADEFDGLFDLVMVELLTRLPGDDNRDSRMAAAAAEFLSLYEGKQRDAAATWLAEETRLNSPRFCVYIRDWTGAYA